MEGFIPFPGDTVHQFIARLNENDPARWGTMSAWHMLEHLVIPLQFSRGVFEVPLVTPLQKVERVKQLMLLGPAPLRRDFQAPFLGPGLQPLKNASFDGAKTELALEIEKFLEFWMEHPEANFTHPVFGPLNREEWFLFHSKHFTHHFSQFGISL